MAFRAELLACHAGRRLLLTPRATSIWSTTACRQIKYMTDRAGLKIVDVALNDVNGGSFAVTVTKPGVRYAANTALVERLLRREDELGLDSLAPYAAFQKAAWRSLR